MEVVCYISNPIAPEPNLPIKLAAVRGKLQKAMLHNLCMCLCLCLILMAMALMPNPAHAKPGYSEFIIDRNTGKTLHAKNADALRYPASLTKMMTLYVVFDLIESGRLTYKTTLRVSKNAAAQQPSKLGLKPGTKISVRTAIRALVTKSANDVAVTVAENLAGTEAKFANIMTWKARQIGMKNTVFKNASGLPNRKQLTTARDMAILGERLMSDFPKHYRFFRTKSFAYKGRSYRNHNSLLHNYSGTDGIKTGYTRASGFNLVASVKRGKKHLIGVVLGGKSTRRRNVSMRSILTRAFKKASSKRTRPAHTVAKTRIPTPMIANMRPRNRPSVRSRVSTDVKIARAPVRHLPSSTRTRFSVPIPKPDLRNVRPAHRRTAAKMRSNGRPIGINPRTRNITGRGNFHVQVGAYKTKREAELKIMEVSHRLAGKLGAHRALTIPFKLNNSKRYYRARFADLTNDGAASLCSRIKAVRLDCFVTRAE